MFVMYVLCTCVSIVSLYRFFFFKQKTAYEMRISDWSSDVCSSDLLGWLWESASWVKVLVGLQPLDNWEPVQLLYNNFAVVLGLVYVHLPFMVDRKSVV